MKKVFVCFFFLISYACLFAQTRVKVPGRTSATEVADTAYMSLAPWPGDAGNGGGTSVGAIDKKLKLSLTLGLKDVSALDSVFVTVGRAIGYGECLNLPLRVTTQNDQLLLHGKTGSFSGNGAGLVVMQLPVSALRFDGARFLCLRGKRKDGTFTNQYIIKY